MRNHISARAELLDDLEAPGFLHEHVLGLVIRVAQFHDKTSRHPPNELALADREWDNLLARRIRTFTDKFDRGFFGALESQLVDVSAKSLI
jgi:hypothetical protein